MQVMKIQQTSPQRAASEHKVLAVVDVLEDILVDYS